MVSWFYGEQGVRYRGADVTLSDRSCIMTLLGVLGEVGLKAGTGNSEAATFTRPVQGLVWGLLRELVYRGGSQLEVLYCLGYTEWEEKWELGLSQREGRREIREGKGGKGKERGNKGRKSEIRV